MHNQQPDIPDELSITFHFINGQSRTFNIFTSRDEQERTLADSRQVIRRFLKEDWWVVQTPERTLYINSSNVLAVEMNPPMPSLEGEGILHTELVTHSHG